MKRQSLLWKVNYNKAINQSLVGCCSFGQGTAGIVFWAGLKLHRLISVVCVHVSVVFSWSYERWIGR